MGSVGAKQSKYSDLINKIQQKPDSTLWRNAMIQRSEYYIGDSDLKMQLYSTIPAPKNFSVSDIDTFSIDTIPDSQGYADVYAKYTLKNEQVSGFTLGGGARIKTKTKQDSGVYRIKILK